MLASSVFDNISQLKRKGDKLDIIFKIIGIALITVVASLIVKPVRSDFAMIITLVGGIIVLALLLSSISSALSLISGIANKTGVNGTLLSLVFKIIGIGYLTEFSASICADAGSSSLGDKVLLGGKIVILVMSLPIITNILNIVMELLPQ